MVNNGKQKVNFRVIPFFPYSSYLFVKHCDSSKHNFGSFHVSLAHLAVVQLFGILELVIREISSWVAKNYKLKAARLSETNLKCVVKNNCFAR